MPTTPASRNPSRSLRRLAAAAIAVAALAAGARAALAHCETGQGPYTQWFRRSECTFSNTGSNPFLVLEPGYWLRLRGYEDGDWTRVDITVLDDTEWVAGVETRVVEEREWINGELVEVSRNFLAICSPTNNVFYFGEDVDNYEDGQIVDHDGSWRAGVAGAHSGLLMPGTLLLGSRYYQEVAPGVALDRACQTREGLRVWTPFGTLEGCIEILETTPLEPDAQSIKMHCPGIGLVNDDGIRLIARGGLPPAAD
jgi:hypothetical protein